MRNADVIRLAEDYLILGIVVVLILFVIFEAGYFLIYKRLFKGKKRVKPHMVFLTGVFLCYLIVVLGATMLNRTGIDNRRAEFRLFASYRLAWNSFSEREWRNIILNILMFVPFGFLLPMVFTKLSAFWKTYLAGFIFTLFIEITQLITGRGVFEADDIWNNLLGAMIGYGIYRMICWLVSRLRTRKKDKNKEVGTEKLRFVLLYQIPALFTVGLFAVIFLAYQNQELGNLRCRYASRISSGKLEVSTDIVLSGDENTVPVYQLHVASPEETEEQAEAFFRQFGLTIDEKRTDIYDDTAIYYSQTGDMSLWIDYAGSTVDFTDFDKRYPEGEEDVKYCTDATEEEVLDALERLGIEIPVGAGFENSGDGRYGFIVRDIRNGDVLYSGSLSCTLTDEKEIMEMSNRIIAYEKYKDFPIKSEQEAYDEIVAGKFKYYFADGNEKRMIEIKSVRLGYMTDTKGFYQPIYIFTALVNGETGSISIPAIK